MTNVPEAERGIEESRKKFGRFYTQINPPVQENEWGEKEAYGSDDIENFWIDVLHQELQKARESWLREEVVKLKDRQLGWLGKEEDGSDRHPNYDEIQTIIDRYQSELDQPNK